MYRAARYRTAELVFSDRHATTDLPAFFKVIRIRDETNPYANQMILVRPDSYIAASSSLSGVSPITSYFDPSFTASSDKR
ncbi:hypothetical protein WT19_24550 [Burkholderia stagnalis]|uniref:hypothetical protein n=1 Tax=Burkholderia stagnalis TaxID=1503054 RepID=UPI00075F3CEC|nr:hypothetical protein [Burkholderia stagnalis]KVO35010.1 hypothetical protein WT17_26825 [Burkholderia stagnalis]KVO66965.1 hypothetical protein WT19_24550 [Burkholderia stagnalis]KVW59649.1 hypothetical protein WT28_20070 [Burkholderia stagnalis]KVX66105.1 hypothetical protein WT34_27495 [Burkholderia stagnalis]VWC23637.1 hypothetical protein BST28156_06020 [Burkholderia stagnalis]